MKIVIGINSFKRKENMEPRELHCIESLEHIKNRYSNIIDLVNIHEIYNGVDSTLNSFQNIPITGKDRFGFCNKMENYINSVWHYNNNQKSSLIAKLTARSHIPDVHFLFDTLFHKCEDDDYFIFLNNDCILSDRLIKMIVETKKDSYAVSRLHIYPLESMSDPIRGESYSVHGFDAFAVKKSVWERYRENFPPYILGRFNWDTHYATLFAMLTDCMFVNKHPICLFHEEHQSTSSRHDVYTEYNNLLFGDSFIEREKWFQYVKGVLLKRQEKEGIKWYIPFSNEEQIEKDHFKYDLMEKMYGK